MLPIDGEVGAVVARDGPAVAGTCHGASLRTFACDAILCRRWLKIHRAADHE